VIAFCGQPAAYAKRNLVKNKYFLVRTKYFQEKNAELHMSCNDYWATKVKGILAFSQDHHALDALYHQQCKFNFRTGKDIPKVFQLSTGSNSKLQHGRTIDSTRNYAFFKDNVLSKGK